MFEVTTEWDGLDEAFAMLEGECTGVVRGIAIEAWDRVLAQTPQLLGRLVASWTFSLNVPITVDRSFAVDVNIDAPLQKGDPEAIDTANFYNRNAADGFQLGMDIFFSNGADHGEGPYASEVERGGAWLRSENQPGRMAQRAFDTMAARYGQNVSAQRAAVLKTFRIGGASAADHP